MKLAATTVLFTLLIWFSADSLNIESVDVPVKIRFVPPAGSNMIIKLPDDAPRTFTLTASGQKRYTQQLNTAVAVEATVTVSDRPTGRVDFTLQPVMLSNLDLLHRLTPQAITPATVPLIIDHRINITVPVEVDPGTLDYEVRPSTDIRQVQVTMNESERLTLVNSQQPTIITIPAGRLLREEPEGSDIRMTVPLQVPWQAENVICEPSRVTLTARLKEQRLVEVIRAVPIKWGFTSDIQQAYVVEHAEPTLTQAVSIRGTPDGIAAAKRGEPRIWGVIDILRTDIDTSRTGAYTERKPRFFLPPGVELAEEPSSVRFRLVRREAAASPP